MQRHHLTRYLAVLGFLAIAPSLEAQAFGINEIGTCAASRGFAVTGAPCADASSIFWNPGMMAPRKGWNILAGAAAIQVNAKFTQDTTFREWEGDVPLAIVPHVFLNYKKSDASRMSFGLGFYVPYGLTSQWTDSFPGRFQAFKASLATFYVQPNVAYQINDTWSIGGGPVVGHSSVELIQALDLAEQNTSTPGVTFSQLGIPRRTEFGRANLEGSALAFGGHVGIYGKPSADVSVGLRFLSPLEFEYDDADATFTQTNTNIVLPPGNPICTQQPALCGGSTTASANIDAILAPQFAAGGALVSQAVATQITHPAQIQAGFGYTGFANWLVSVDYAWTGWKRFKELPVTFAGPAPDRILIEDYNHTSSLRVGAERGFTNGARFRLGFSGVASAAPDETVTALLPEQDRAYASIGGGYPITSNLTIEGAYLRVMAAGKRGRIQDRTARTQAAASLNSGVYDLSANVFSISLKANY
jgi:long-chain fatty acid transport protein